MSPVLYRGANAEPNVASPRQDFAALLAGSVVMAAPWRRRVRVSGPDAQRWLNGMVTGNTAALAPGEGCYCFLLNPQGRIQGDLTAFRTNASGDAEFLLETDAAQLDGIVAWLDRYIIMDDVTLAVDDSAQAVVLAGAAASQLLGDPEADLRLCSLEIGGQAVTGWRDPSLRLPAFTLWAADAASLVTQLLALGAVPAGFLSLEGLRIASGVPLARQDIRERDLPQETAQQRALHFSKGCYLGQEIVERIHSRGNVHRALTLFTLAAAPAAELPLAIVDGDKEIGDLTSVATLPLSAGDVTAGLGIVRAAGANKVLTAGGIPVTVQTRPVL